MQDNTMDTRLPTFYNCGWRPFVGWGCAVAFLYATLLEPILRFIAVVVFGYSGVFPVLNTDLVSFTLVSMLGMAGLRSYDKKQGVVK